MIQAKEPTHFRGATIFSIMTLSITTLSLIDLIVTLSITTQNKH
jgi:hypothetical protein